MEALVELDMPRKNGTTLRGHLEQVERATGRRQIEHPEIPLEGMHLWEWFWELNQGRSGGFGPEPLPFAEIEAWSRLSRTSLTVWEVGALKRMDRAYLHAAAEMAKREK